MPPKKILIASPIRSGMSPSYVRATIALLNSSLCRGENRPYSIEFAWTSGTSVAMARDENANLFLQRGDDELIQWDSDLGVADPQYMVSMFNRLLSHDVDIVGGAYVSHNFISHWHGAAASTDANISTNGLLPMAQIPLGFSKTKRRVFDKIKQTHPHLLYQMKETEMQQARTLFEFFPNGIVGPNTGQGKVNQIMEILNNWSKNGGDASAILNAVAKIIHASDYSQNVMLGEDFYFCFLARQAGFEIFIDNNLIVPHLTDIRLPVKNQLLLQALMEEWRWCDKVKAEEIRPLIESLQKLINQDIP